MQQTKQIINNAKADADIPDKVWNTYLREKYAKKYRVKMGQDRIWYILCKYGEIDVFSLKKGFLMFYGYYPTKSRKTFLIRKCPSFVRFFAEGDMECGCLFPESKLKVMEKIFIIRKKKRLSEAQKEVLRKSLAKARESKRLNPVRRHKL